MTAESLPRRLASALRKRWRGWLRAVHRDCGYIVVGLTFVYALSGLAINHIGQLDPNFRKVEETHQLSGALPRGSDEEIARAVLAELDIKDEPDDIYAPDAHELEISFDKRKLIVDLETATVKDTREEARFFLRVANWLHYNRGKAAWTYIADGYAVILLFLATSGVFMLKGRKGLVGRGAVLILLGSLVPILYVHLSGGPGG